MTRGFWVLFAGAVCGVLAYAGWFAVHRPAWSGELDPQLGWMQESLQLSPEQFAQLKALHEQSRPRMLELASQVAQMRRELALFEHEQKTENIDFVAFARFVQQRRAVGSACLESTRQLVLAASAVLDPQQRKRYQALVEPALQAPARDRLD